MTKQEIHANLCDGLKELYRAKNKDYGDSYAKVRDIIPESILVRLHDKLERVTQLMLNRKVGQEVKDESIEDTLRDLANYALLELVEMEVDKTTLQGEPLQVKIKEGVTAEDVLNTVRTQKLFNSESGSAVEHRDFTNVTSKQS